MYQQLALQISLALIALLLAVFVAVAINSRRKEEYALIQKRGYRIRTGLFWALLLLMMPVMVYSMGELPYDAPSDSRGEVQVVDAVGHQWYWTLSRDQVRRGQPVEFRVTSADVNHGFGIYDQNMQLLAQTQAMPGYTNRLRFTFSRAGSYRILCMEYCGLVHHNMIAELKVGS